MRKIRNKYVQFRSDYVPLQYSNKGIYIYQPNDNWITFILVLLRLVAVPGLPSTTSRKRLMNTPLANSSYV